jgi:hypothetical protein
MLVSILSPDASPNLVQTLLEPFRGFHQCWWKWYKNVETMIDGSEKCHSNSSTDNSTETNQGCLTGRQLAHTVVPLVDTCFQQELPIGIVIQSRSLIWYAK